VSSFLTAQKNWLEKLIYNPCLKPQMMWCPHPHKVHVT